MGTKTDVYKRGGDGIRTYSELSERKRAFAEYVCQGYSKTEAYFLAGYLAGKDQRNPAVRNQATNCSCRLSKEPLVREYIELNMAKPMSDYGDIDIGEIAERMKTIMGGRINVRITTKGGKVVDVPPTFGEQTKAGELLFKIYQYMDKGRKGDDRSIKRMSKELEERTRDAMKVYLAPTPYSSEVEQVTVEDIADE